MKNNYYIHRKSGIQWYETIPDHAYVAGGYQDENDKGCLYIHIDCCLTPLFDHDGTHVKIADEKYFGKTISEAIKQAE